MCHCYEVAFNISQCYQNITPILSTSCSYKKMQGICTNFGHMTVSCMLALQIIYRLWAKMAHPSLKMKQSLKAQIPWNKYIIVKQGKECVR